MFLLGAANAYLFGGEMIRPWLTVVLTVVSVSAFGKGYPTSPDPQLTPGDVCTSPDSYRYQERIAYCKRDVEGNVKWQVIETYNDKLGTEINRGNRHQFKIDHYIPLCAGGSNDVENLWPQHESVYRVTDPLEGAACEKMKAGRLRQARAIELIRRAKNDLSQANAVLAEIQSL